MEQMFLISPNLYCYKPNLKSQLQASLKINLNSGLPTSKQSSTDKLECFEGATSRVSRLEKFSLNISSSSFVTESCQSSSSQAVRASRPCETCPSLTISVPLCLIMIILVNHCLKVSFNLTSISISTTWLPFEHLCNKKFKTQNLVDSSSSTNLDKPRYQLFRRSFQLGDKNSCHGQDRHLNGEN